MTIRFSNLVSQQAKFYTGTPNYCDVDNTFTPVENKVTFAAKASDDSWADGDTFGIRIYKSPENYKIWYASWDATNEYIEVITEEESVGSMFDDDDVTVTLVVTGKTMDHSIWEPQFREVSGTTADITQADTGKIIATTSGSATTLTIQNDVTYPFHCIIVQEGVGVATLAPESPATLNGAGSSIDVPAQFQSLHVYCRSAAATFIVVGA